MQFQRTEGTQFFPLAVVAEHSFVVESKFVLMRKHVHPRRPTRLLLGQACHIVNANVSCFSMYHPHPTTHIEFVLLSFDAPVWCGSMISKRRGISWIFKA